MLTPQEKRAKIKNLVSRQRQILGDVLALSEKRTKLPELESRAYSKELVDIETELLALTGADQPEEK